MHYLVQIGLAQQESEAKKVEGELEKALSESTKVEYNEDLELRTYMGILKAFSLDRYREIQLALKDNSHIRGKPYGSQVEVVLSYLFFPLQDKEKIIKRQDLIRSYIQSGKESDLVKTTRETLESHSLLYGWVGGEVERIDIRKIAGPFSHFVDSVKKLSEILNQNPLFRNFALRMQELLSGHPIAQEYMLFGDQPTLVVDRDGFYLVRSPPREKGVFDLDLFQRARNCPLKDYPGDAEDCLKILELAFDFAPVVYVLGSFFYQADIYCKRKELGLPVCIPNINDRGEFKVEQAYPIVTKLDRRQATLVSFQYTPDKRKFLIGGAHSGAKTESLKNIGAYHVVGLGGGILFCEEGAEIPLTTRVITLFKKSQESGKGALESEVKEVLQLERDTGEHDLVLIDEFLDTTKPELAIHIADPVLRGESGLCRGLANSPGRVFIVDHRASRMEDDYGFTFMSPELKKMKLSAYERERLQDQGYYVPDDFFEGRQDRTVLVPTHRLVIGKPNPEQVQNNALLMWEQVQREVKRNRREIEKWGLGGGLQDYGIGKPEPRKRSRQAKSAEKRQEYEDVWGKWEKPKPIEEPKSETEPCPTIRDEKPETDPESTWKSRPGELPLGGDGSDGLAF